MQEYDEELKRLRQQTARLQHNRARRETLQQQAAALQEEAEQLCRAWRAEEQDVEDLDRLTFAAIWANLSGRKEERLEKEEAEAYAARMKYEAAERQLAEVREEISRCEAELAEDQGCEERFWQVLAEKREALKQENPAAAEQISALEEQLAELESRRRELDEALSAGREVWCRLGQVISDLDSAQGWGTWDVIGGGLLTDLMKYSRLDDAQASMERLQSALRQYRAELADVTALHIGPFAPEGFSRTMDIWFDNIFSDWSVLERIDRSVSQVQDLKAQVQRMQDQLNGDLEQTLQDQKAVQDSLDRLVETA